ncbi:C-type lectin domain protein [Candidatus Magnetobacterium bavaricum]|uniref:C-type lectin domain protein n=1 Tax=Candidatus Magnetobacterium bavaricum TaxID=29290 RepID=A0A0F3GUX1_9BACT|nr:C-type lectin domain protein [Candidatus Magnetobacterium bavaricum]
MAWYLHVWGGVAAADSEKVVNPANNHTYQRIDTPMTWADAKANCEKLGGYLATVTSDSEEQFIVNSFNQKYESWLGATDAEVEGTWKWITGEKWGYTDWNPVEPNNKEGNENCLVYAGSFGHWLDYSCSYKVTLLCEWDAQSQYTLTVAKSGTGTGNVTASTGTLSWSGNTGTASYTTATSVILTATADSGSTFGGWTGCDSTSGNICAVNVTSSKTITVTFISADTGTNQGPEVRLQRRWHRRHPLAQQGNRHGIHLPHEGGRYHTHPWDTGDS